MSNMTNDLISRAIEYAAVAGLELSTLGRKIMNDGKFFSRLENGTQISLASYEKCQAYFDDVAPETHHKSKDD